MDPNFRFRTIEEQDIAGILKTAIELGYPASEKTVKDLVELVLERNDHQIIIAEAEKKLLGYIHLHCIEIESERQKIEVSGILIPDSQRSKGIGSRFLKEAEKWARSRDIHTISIRTNLIRQEAIPFFKHHGFQHNTSVDAFIKHLV
jgi:N-acetylglutamate synthase-like GNAT family acetyltransferase